MTNRELLEMAAKAANISLKDWRDDWSESMGCSLCGEAFRTHDNELWNPLRDDGDALRLLAILDFSIARNYFSNKWVVRKLSLYTLAYIFEIFEEINAENPSESLRRAIVRCAAEIGKEK